MPVIITLIALLKKTEKTVITQLGCFVTLYVNRNKVFLKKGESGEPLSAFLITRMGRIK